METQNQTKNAIILAAGFGMRMVPINTMYTKGMLKVNGEPLIERLICQLRDADVKDISIVVGFMKEEYEYLIDKYDARLIVNSEYLEKNNLYSLWLAKEKLKRTFIVPCDIWCKENPFINASEESWYMVSDMVVDESVFRVNRRREISVTSLQKAGNGMIGIAYLTQDDSEKLRNNLCSMVDSGEHDNDFWEDALISEKKFALPARVVSASDAVEINTYEQLRDLDAHSGHLKSDALSVIAQEFCADEMDITDITVLKKGMTNRSFKFSVHDEKYIMRIPGEGTDQLINRQQEADVFKAISGLGLCDDPVYINPTNGYKITKYLDRIRCCDPENSDDLKKCMKKLREFHELKLKVSHTFDIFGQIEFYESLWDGTPSAYKDYVQTKKNALSLKAYIDSTEKEWCLTHIDAVPDNFLFYTPKGESDEVLQLTDWEYAGMQDPHVDIAMFCIYSLYSKQQCDNLIDLYFDNNCNQLIRTKIYCYIAVCGLLWSNWCEYKRKLGVEFGEYSLCQYRYAKDFYRYAKELMGA